MEDNLQRVFSVLISVLILFLMPLYITFEKMDDISYSLALKITSNFVDNVNAKGYNTIIVDEEKCVVCGMCYRVCPDYVFEIR